MALLPRHRSLFSGKLLLCMLLLIVILHLIGLVLFTESNKHLTRQFQKASIIHDVIDILLTVRDTPTKDRQEVINSLNNPSLVTSITEEPVWDWRIVKYKMWQLDQILKHPKAHEASFKLQDGRWLNFKVTPPPYNHLHQILLVLFELVLLLAILTCIWIFQRFSVPLRQFKQAAERLGIDIHTEPLSTQGTSLVRETADAMNQLQTRIVSLLKDRTQMLAAISHDLRTPITRLKLRAQTISDKDKIKKIVKDLNEMELMISQILAFAKQDKEDEEKTKLDLISLLSSICDDMVDVGYQISFDTELARLPFEGRRLGLKRAFTNLITNATRYSEQVWVHVITNGKAIRILIEDNGPGIPESDITSVLQPYYQSKDGSSNARGGAGLGLAVADSIIRAHNGRIMLENRKQGGLCVTIEFG